MRHGSLISALYILVAYLCPNQAQVAQEPMVQTLSAYFSQAELELHLQNLQARCGQIARLYPYGTSHEGRKLWALELQFAPADGSMLPGFKYVGGLHGDEPSGRQLLLHLADHLCHAYLRHDKASHAAPTAEATASEEGQAQAIGSAQQHETLPRSLRLLLQPQQQRKGEGTPESTGTGVLEHMDWEADATAVHLLRHVRLVLLPDANPDGYQQRQRESMAGIDLNRDYPDPWLIRQGPTPSQDLAAPTGQEQPETLAHMNVTLHGHFIASVSLHEGALVANYPLDGYSDGSEDMRGQKQAAQDDETFVHLAQTYARLHKTMMQSPEFPGGITNGAQWYPLYGGAQDWSYLAAHVMELTIEVNQQKSPPAEELPRLWAENAPALLLYPMAAIMQGLHGRVQNQRGCPLNAQITVKGSDFVTRTLPGSARFHRPLAPGRHTVQVIAGGCAPYHLNVTVPPRQGLSGWSSGRLHHHVGIVAVMACDTRAACMRGGLGYGESISQTRSSGSRSLLSASGDGHGPEAQGRVFGYVGGGQPHVAEWHKRHRTKQVAIG